MSVSHIKDIESRLAGHAWSIEEREGNNRDIAAYWDISKYGKQLTLAFEGMDEHGVLEIDRSYACHIERQPGISLYFSKNNHNEYRKNLGEFLAKLDAAISGQHAEKAAHEFDMVPADGENGGFDWAIDGQPLGRWMARWTKNPPRPRKGFNLPTTVEGDIRQLAGKTAGNETRILRSMRAPLYICSECGDLGCGCFAVRVTIDKDTVTWDDFANEPSATPDADYIHVPALQFDKTAYLSALSGLL